MLPGAPTSGCPAVVFGSLFVKPSEVMSVEFELVMVIVSVVVPFARMEPAPKASVIEGGASTVTSSAVELVGL